MLTLEYQRARVHTVRRGSLLLVLGLVWLSAELPAAARGRTSARPSAQTGKNSSRQRIARKHFSQGKRWFFRRKYKKAIESFLKAYEYWDHPSVLYNLASAYALKGEPIKARVYLRIFLRRTHRDPKRLPRILRRVLRETGILTIKIRQGPPDLQIYVDGRASGRLSAEMVVRPGQRIVEIRVGDRVIRRRSLDVPAGGERTWELDRIASPRPPPGKSNRPRGRTTRLHRESGFTGCTS